MKSITIHGLDDQLCERIKAIAVRQGLSLNDTIISLLDKSLGIDRTSAAVQREDFLEFFGAWTDEESMEFERAIADFDK